MVKNVLGPIIKKLRIQQHLTQAQLSKLTGFSQNTISNHENQKRALSEQEIATYAHTFKVTPQFLYDLQQKDAHDPSQNHSYTYFDKGLSAGLPENVEALTKQQSKILNLPDLFLGKYAGQQDIFTIKVNGESMNRVLPNNALIAVKSVTEIAELHNNDLVVFKVNQELAVKRYFYDAIKQTIIFRPDSNDPRFHSLTYSLTDFDDVQIIGRVILCITQF
ncbi:XRE family transcriptional regulator [Bombilactobacillus folatiphilus]|uniref:XRE family transcriptional regulator n=1 Tax=Bombilactobacillus folatiphilus TaxID=2923362 RepID=A0ABY4P7I0_9LACO|nr:XRE family transcriptional regulator [Bombilactobacillus folatiphilus]UQS81551.1 XRE family transcriptional regulator [Bombilactobacillus folatiphilus]